LQVLTGRFAGKKAWLEKESPVRVGQSARAELAIVSDEHLGAIHFDAAWDGEKCVLSTHAGSRLQVNGKAAEGRTAAENGAFIVAGHTSFLLRVVSEDLRANLPPAPPDARPATKSLMAARRRALETLKGKTRLFALLDAARDRRIRALLAGSRVTHESLFEGQKGEFLAEVAPYLVEITPASELLEVLVLDAWGESWGVYLTGLRPFKEVRRRLRRSLMVADEATGKKLYFRFYDPRVLRAFWPTCSPRQRSEILGNEIDEILLEGAEDALIRLSP